MHDALRVSGREPLRDLLRNPHRLAHIERPVPMNPSFQRFALHIVHHQKRRILFDGVNGDDVLMTNSRRRAAFAHKTLSSLTIPRQMRSQQFDGDDSSQ